MRLPGRRYRPCLSCRSPKPRDVDVCPRCSRATESIPVTALTSPAIPGESWGYE